MFIVDNGVKVYPVNPPWVNPGGTRKSGEGTITTAARHPFCMVHNSEAVEQGAPSSAGGAAKASRSQRTDVIIHDGRPLTQQMLGRSKAAYKALDG